MSKLSPKITGMLCLLTVASVSATGLKESFLNVSEGALLTTLPGWTFSGDKDDWSITSAGKDGGAAEARSPGTYQRVLTADEVVDPTSGPAVFKAKIRLVGSDSWADVRISLLQSGGVNGAGLCFQGGSSEGSADNVIGISEGGTFWGDVKLQMVEAQWQPDVWYQVEIDDLKWDGGRLSGLVSVYEVDNSSQKLVDRKPIGVFGDSAGFNKIDLLSFGSVGAARVFQIVDIEFRPVTEIAKK